MNPWTLLGIEPTRDTVAIKRAYARLLKRCRPDDDAAAYQRLRESYEWALQWAQYATDDAPADAEIQADLSPVAPAEAGTAEPEPAAMAVPTSEPVADAPTSSELSATADAGMESTASSATEPEPAPVDPEGLARSFYAYFEEKGADAAVAALPALESWLDSIALSRRDEASRWFASLVAEVPGLPDPVVTKLVEYFGWLSDFRSAAVLGNDRLEALRARAHRAGLLAMRDPAVLDRYRRLRWLDRALQQGHSWLATLLALSCDGRDRERWADTDFGQRRALGMNASGAIDDLLDRCGRIRFWMLGLALYVLAKVDPLDRGGEEFLVMAAAVVPLLLANFADAVISEVIQFGRSTPPTPPGRWRWFIAAALPALAAFAVPWIDSQTLDYMLIAVSSAAGITLGWPPNRHWRSLPAVQTAAVAWILVRLGYDPQLSWCWSLAILLSLAAIADVKSDELHTLARRPLRAWLSMSGWGWFWVILCIKFTVMLAVLPMVVTPLISLLQARRHGMRFALLTLGGAVALAGALRLTAHEAAMLLIAAPWLSGWLQRSIQKALEWWAQKRLATTAG